MVWGMRMPSGYGDYSPKGNHGSWKEAIQQHFEQQMSEVERAKFENWHVFYRASISKRFATEGARIEPHGWPTEYYLSKSYDNLGSLLEFHNRLLGVDEALKSIIESLEPGVHQFSPITIKMPKGEAYPKQYYAMVISQFHDSFSPEQSEDGSFRAKINKDYTRYRVDIPKKAKFNGLALERSVFASSHLWRERKLLDPHVYLSDKLQAEIASHGLRVPKMFQLKEV